MVDTFDAQQRWFDVLAPLLVPLAVLGASQHLVPLRIHEELVIDGRLDEPSWARAPASDAFTQSFPDDGRPPTERTRVRVLYDERALYVGIECDQRHSPITERLTRRDRPVETDVVHVAIDSLGNGTSAYEFSVTAAGTLVDEILFDDVNSSTEWDEIWEAEVRRTRHAWFVEYRIPLRALRFTAAARQIWGFQVERYVVARAEIDQWAYIPMTTGGEVSEFGTLGPLEGLRPGTPYELRPAAVTRWRRRDDAGAASGWDARGSAGLDVKWHLASDMTLDATFLPDFAQVEADQVVLNLSTYETFFPEKRPFFLEGLDTFITPMQILYTRRIGAAAFGAVLPPGEVATDLPEPALIYAGAKVVGHLLGSLQVGALSALTGANELPTLTDEGDRFDRPFDPMTMFHALRLKQSVGTNASVGLTMAATTRFEDPERYPVFDNPFTGQRETLCPQGLRVGLAERCFHDAYVAALDWRWRSRSGVYALSGQAAGSWIEGGPARHLPDGSVIGSGDVAPGARLVFAKEGGEHWYWSAAYETYAPKLELNDAGFLARQNLHQWSAGFGYRTIQPFGPTQTTRTGLSASHRRNWDGFALATNATLSTFASLPSLWSVSASFMLDVQSYDDRQLGDGTVVERARRTGGSVSLGTPLTKPVNSRVSLNASALPDGLEVNGNVTLTSNVLTQLELTISLSAGYSDGEQRFIGRGSGGSLAFGRQRSESAGASLQATFAFTPRLTLQAYAQLFVASVDYRRFTAYSGSDSVIRFSALRPADPPFNPDFQFGALNTSVFLQWEYQLGQSLYIVYTRSQEADQEVDPTGEVLAPRLDIPAIGRGPAVDVIFLKLVFWWA